MLDLNDMSRSQIMRAKMRLTCSAANEAFADFWSRKDLPAVVPAFLVLLHQIMRSAVPLLQTARDRCAALAEEDELAAKLHRYYAKHALEERDHDVWALNDMEAAGFRREDVLAQVPMADLASMMGAQYYWIHHHHPVMFMGCLAMLEGSPPSVTLIERLENESGLPKEAFRTYRYHGDVDPHHLEDLDRAIDELPLTRDHMALISLSATHTSNMMASCIRRLGPDDAPARQG
ncbi:MAG: iron-containing redox enzyme family protein [Pseudomonadota bacterium]